jgi:CheY-like chemotaxis protein
VSPRFDPVESLDDAMPLVSPLAPRTSNPPTRGRTLGSALRRIGLSLIKTVFVVDDDRIIASTTTAVLQLSGYEARCFVDPLEALKAAQNIRPDLVIADVVMPGMSGIDLALRLKELCPTCKVLLFSGQTVTADLLEAARALGNDFQVLAKPIHPTDLLARIRDTDVPDLGVA